MPLRRRRFGNSKTLALGRLKGGVMNKTEQAYVDEVIKPAMESGEIIWYKFEGMTFKLGEGVRYTPDFPVMLPDGEIQIHEVKGRWMGDAKVKIRMAADLFPFLFKAVYKQPKKDGGGWREEEF
jgi:hypothetical protein